MKALTAKLGALGLVLTNCVLLPAGAQDAQSEGVQPSKQTNVGAVTGITVGAVTGGPVGAVVGGAAGALLGDRWHRQASARATLAQDLEQSEAERARLTQRVAELGSSLGEAQARGEALGQLVRATDDLGVDVTFRTDDDALTAERLPPLLKLGALVATLPQAQLVVAGYADPRGSEAYNDALSLRRAEAVAAVLAGAGVPKERIVIEAHGKSAASSAVGDVEGYAFDRRVTVRVQLPVQAQVASRD